MENMNYDSIEEVLMVIEALKDEYRDSEYFEEYGIEPEFYYTCGECGTFYSLLKSIFPQANCYALGNFHHIITEIDGICYDVNGVYDRFDFDSTEDACEYCEEGNCDGSCELTQEPLVLIPEQTPMEKLVKSFAFSIAEGFFGGGGGTRVRSLAEMDCMQEQERRIAFEWYRKHNFRYFENLFEEYCEMFNNDKYYTEEFYESAASVEYPL